MLVDTKVGLNARQFLAVIVTYHFLIMKHKSFILIVVLSLFIEVALSPIRMFISCNASTLIGFVAYFGLSLFCFRKYSIRFSKGQILLALTIGLFVLHIPLRLIDFDGSLISLPDFLFHFLGIIIGFVFIKLQDYKKWVILGLSTVLAIFMYFKGYSFWLHKLNFSTFSGNVNFTLPISIRGYDQNNQLITNKAFHNRIVVLDFWHTQCGVCFRKFPEVQKLFNKYGKDQAVLLFAINNPSKQDTTGQAFAMLKDRGYTFPVVVPTVDTIPQAFGVTHYPTTIIIDKTGNVVFRGAIENAEKVIDELLKNGM